MNIENKELVSLCIFTYMQENYVEQALKGVLSQTYSPLEVIISDDCSSDNTFKIIKKVTAEYKGSATIIINKNKVNIGLTANVNKVFSMAKGEYIMVAAGDDISLPNRVSKFMEVFESDKEIVSISCNLKEINDTGNIISAPTGDRLNITYAIDDYLANEKFHVNGASRAIHRSVYDTFSDLNPKCPTEDTPYLLRAFLLGKVMLLAEELVLYRVHTENLSADKNLFKMNIFQIIGQYKIDIDKALKEKLISVKQKKDLLKKIIRIEKNRKQAKLNYQKTQLKNTLNYLIKPSSLNSNKLFNRLNNNVYLWWCDNEGVFNFGDELNPYLISKITGKKIIKKKSLWKRFQIRRIYIGIGSVIENANKNTIVWGAGIISKDQQIRKSIYTAVRGPLTQKRMVECGLTPPNVIGDPALLLPLFYIPKKSKPYHYGIIPHIADYDLIKNKFDNDPSVLIIDFTKDIEDTIDLLASCELIISSSLHGIIVANAYNIPSVWVGFSSKLAGDDIKFHDYFISVGITEKIKKITIIPEQFNLNFINNTLLTASQINPEKNSIKKIQESLLNNHPF